MPYAKADRSTTKSLFRAEIRAVGSTNVFSSKIVFEHDSLNIVCVVINGEVHQIFIDRYCVVATFI